MSNSPLVSAIIIFYNGQQFLEEAILSIFAQTYDHWELLLIDDGSTDQSTNIALDYVQKYPQKVRYFQHPDHQNRGASSTRNLGIHHAKGTYIAFLDADDVWLPEKLTQQLAIFQAYPEAAMVYGRTQYWYSWTGKPEDSNRDFFMDLGVKPNSLVHPPSLLFLLWKDNTQKPTTCNALIRSDIFAEIGSFEENWRGFAEDRVFFTKLELHKSVYVADNFWAKYRQHNNSTTSILSDNKKQFLGYQNYFNWVEKYLQTLNLVNTEVWQQFQRAKFIYGNQLTYFFFRGYTNLLMSMGRKVLPVRFRHWLWLNIVSKLAHHQLDKMKP